MHYETAPAKINLTLDTLFKRADNFHEVSMVMTTVDLNDQLSFEKRDDNKIIIETENQYLPNDKKNLAYQAAALMMEAYGISAGVNIFIDKNIPISAGLAGGSSDAAATFRGMNALYGLGRPLEELADLSAQLGSDIPFCVYGRTALCTGRGEKVSLLPKPTNAWVILAKPSIGVSTKTIYSHLNPGKHEPASGKVVEAALAGDYDGVIHHMKNDLEEVTVEHYPEVARLIQNMEASGADKAMMSGSGPTVVGLVQKERQAIHVYNSMRGCCNEVYRVRLLG
ncbi:4-(cytidine 5'-diphospho)-2-C-methyl-D-erythritol kinase [Lacicoccus alkaliphilus]|uniref:4-diphosphocytidyl-2-C-methyl-D-erythritol kinase n=1 Tax=Lacicoccus alkaliphilus DSM 16010 TaxID=1123231 RepID=A0A1M7K3I3_9BACL|nr:4-(cytidine 5'-diphospho)-2-C-methyl-D-erythritol kinase [Salinicoccus alkaliphilus]SHM59523.1 4-diphosphocytidyl-2-C-methyl-D-erythritol kinase [Salinicoccus alkaliphilus DSM 16010]